MTGLPEFNYPAFHAEAARLRTLGLEVENPAENPLPANAPWHLCIRGVQFAKCSHVTQWPPFPTGSTPPARSLR
ncbi:MAG TPA: DUF4406 domain-containing protein [Pseudomonas sp.]